MRSPSFFAQRFAGNPAVVALTLLAVLQIGDKSVGQSVVLSFGSNSLGVTGQGTTSGTTPVATPIRATNLMDKTITQAAAGYSHSLLLADDGSVFSSGWNENGRTGLGTSSGSTLIATPIRTTNLIDKTITQVAPGEYFSLLLADDGSVFSFGNNAWNGQGTTGADALIAAPIDTTNLLGKTITQVAAGSRHSLLLADDGTVFSFGSSTGGRSGLGTSFRDTRVATPIDATNLAGKTITQVSAGEYHSLLLADDGTVFSFGAGEGFWGQGGLGPFVGALIATPIDTTNLAGKTITQVAAGSRHSLLLADDGTVFSFGMNWLGVTGLGIEEASETLVATPIDTTNLVGKTITQVAAGDRFSLLLADDGTVFSFGWNDVGQFGLGTTSGNRLIATPIDTTNLAGLRVIGISAGHAHALLLAVPVPEPAPDFNNDGSIDCTDIDALVAEIAAGTNSGLFDLTGDGLVDIADLDEWRVQGGAANLASGNPYLEGDANLDGAVDGSDFSIWNTHKFTNVAAWCSGDFNANGAVEGSDFSIWSSNKFTTSATASAVPEPAASLRWLIICLALSAKRPRW